MHIPLPGIQDQQKAIFKQHTEEAIRQLHKNLEAPVLPAQDEVNEDSYPRTHLLRESEGWEPPHPDIVSAYFRHFQAHFPEYNTDGKLARLLRLSSDRRVRAFKSGEKIVPYGVWREFLVITGRAPQDILPVFAFMA